MTLYISHRETGVRRGADACPGIDERGHGLTMSLIHDSGCCQEWTSGQAPTTGRAEVFRAAAARWGETWPAPDLGAELAAATEPEAAADHQAAAGPDLTPEPEAEAEA